MIRGITPAGAFPMRVGNIYPPEGCRLVAGIFF